MQQLDFSSNEDSKKSKSFQKQESSLEYFEKVMAEELAQFPRIFREAFDETMNYLSRYPPSTYPASLKAQLMSFHTRRLMSEAFPALFGTKGQRFFIEKAGYRLYFKKFDRNLKPMNNPTRNSDRILNGQYEIFPEYVLIEVFAGYQVNKTKDYITGMFVVRFVRNQAQWVIDLSKFEGPGDSFLGIQPTGPSPDEDDGIVVIPKAI